MLAGLADHRVRAGGLSTATFTRIPSCSMQEQRTAAMAAERLRSRRLRGDRRASAARGRRAARERRRPDGDAARRHGRAADPRGDRAALRQHRDGDRPGRPRDAGDARLRARHARRLARRRPRPCSPASRDAWQGTVLAVFQPAEETAQGAQAMIDDGLFDRFPKPDVILGQHVMPAPAGLISCRPGTTQAAADSLEVRLFGRGAHGSMPESSVDPVVMAAATVLRLQTIVSREIAADAGRGRDRRRAAGRHQGQRHPRRRAAEDQRPHLRRGRPRATSWTPSSGSSTPRRRPRARPDRPRSRPPSTTR